MLKWIRVSSWDTHLLARHIEVRKDTFLDVVVITTKDIVEDGDQQEAPPKDEDNKDNCLVMIGSPRETILWRTF